MSRLKFGYNTNGFAHHSLQDAIEIIAALGYDGIAVTIDVNHLNPFLCEASDVTPYRKLLRKHSLEAVVEGGGRYILDRVRKHEPSLISRKGRNRRLEYLQHCIAIASILHAKVLSFASGFKDPNVSEKTARKYLVDAIQQLCSYADEHGVVLALEPEPGMFVETLADYDSIKEESGRDDLRLTLDIGHIYCCEKEPAERIIDMYKDEMVNVHLEDIKGGVHQHLPPGEGDVDFPAVLKALKAINYRGLVNLELSRSSHDAPRVARDALAYLKRIR
ncbi:MAG: sugar phosphate isomerase/epimerase family protein [Planctomycetota bacterium]